MKNSDENPQNHSQSNIEYKSSVSYLYQKFLSIDKRIRFNLMIGLSMITIVVMTGIGLSMVSLVQFGGSLLDDAFAEGKKETLRSVQNQKNQKEAEKNILRSNKN